MSNAYIYYTGIGAKTDGCHTPAEFKKIMKKITAKDVANKSTFDKYTMQQWMMYSGAELRSKKKSTQKK